MSTAVESEKREVVTPCPVCGSYANTTLAERSALLAVCDVLVMRALEVVGKRIVRGVPRRLNRHHLLGNRPSYVAHTLWAPEERMIRGGLEHAWDVVPAMLSSHGSCGKTPVQITKVLDEYTRSLLMSGTEHDIDQLRVFFKQRLNLDLPTVPE